MPYITEEELQKHSKQVTDLKGQVTTIEELKGMSEKEHLNTIERIKKSTKKFKISTVVLGLLALLGIGGSFYFMNSGLSTSNTVSVEDHEAEVGILQEKVARMEENSAYLDSSLDEIETYAVQIGAFEQKDLSLYSENFVNFKEIRKEEYNKYALGNFESFEDAKLFRQELVDLGFTDAFIGAYQNGERLRIEKVE